MRTNVKLIIHDSGNLTLTNRIIDLRFVNCRKITSYFQLYNLVTNLSKTRPNAIIYRDRKTRELLINYTISMARHDFYNLRPCDAKQLKLNLK